MLPVLTYQERKSMELHKAPVLQILSIRLGPHCPTDADVGEWVENAVNRGVRELFFTLQWSADPTRLPKSLNTCKTLLHLRLSHKILVDFPTSSCLPSLERLQLYYVVYKDEASLVALLSSCPVLELLYVMRNEDDNVAKFSVKVPCLRVLLYFNAMSPDENDVVDPGRSLVVDTPALKHFYIGDHSGDSWSIKSMHCLQDVFIIGQSFHDMSKLLRSASAVSYLGLHLTDELAVYCSTIEFPQLIQCTISPCNSNWMDSLILFLGNTPKLKELTVDYLIAIVASQSLTYEPPVASASWMLRFPDPECLSSSLKKKKEEKELVEYILGTSKCLRTVTISLRSNLKDKETIMETLKAIFVRSNPYFRFGEIHVSIRFTEQTVFVEVAETDSSGEFWVLQLRTSYALQAAFSSMQPPEHISTFTKKVSSTPSKHGGVQKIELATIVEFIVCVVNSPPQVCGTIEFHCTGQVDDSEKTDGPMLHHQSFAYKEVVTTLEMIFWML
ncbi:hypothetical protein HID58_063151 [Brassica napus]|uniref:FBD domain-containing protein n=1 Tax=Brassica napus TaxID=3708 RepID=A0ABQ8A3F6_BRANA|nr:hypothetical protein HID58_063151 [Brassica napus]